MPRKKTKNEPRPNTNEETKDRFPTAGFGSLPKRPPQTVELISENNAKRKQTRVYRTQKLGSRSAYLTDLVERGMEALATSDQTDRVSLYDTERLKEQTFVYLDTCAKDGILPDWQSFALALGHTRGNLDRYVKEHDENDPSCVFLTKVKELFSALLGQAALNNDVNTIFAIFSQKAQFGWREDIHIVAQQESPLGLPKTDEEIKKINERYMADAIEEERA